MLLDTTFLIHLSGQLGKPMYHRAAAMLESAKIPLYTSRICWAEFAEGFSSLEQMDSYLEDIAVLEVDGEDAWTASRIARMLDRTGLHIGDNDIWIAATAMVYGLPVVTLNDRHLAASVV